MKSQMLPQERQRDRATGPGNGPPDVPPKSGDSLRPNPAAGADQPELKALIDQLIRDSLDVLREPTAASTLDLGVATLARVWGKSNLSPHVLANMATKTTQRLGVDAARPPPTVSLRPARRSPRVIRL